MISAMTDLDVGTLLFYGVDVSHRSCNGVYISKFFMFPKFLTAKLVTQVIGIIRLENLLKNSSPELGTVF